MIGGLLVLAAAGGLAAALWSKAPPVESVDPKPVVTQTPVTPTPVPPPVVPLAPKEHLVVVEVKPASFTGAVLMNGAEKLGKLPGTFKLRSADMPVTLSAQREGYKNFDFVVKDDPDKTDLVFLVQLEPLRKAPPPKGASKHAGAAVHNVEKPPEVKPPPVAQPEVKPPPKPQRKLDGDLMNPFDNK